MRLAWSNILHDRIRFLVAVLGVACAVFLIVFQGSVLAGFLQAALVRVLELMDAAIRVSQPEQSLRLRSFPSQSPRKLPVFLNRNSIAPSQLLSSNLGSHLHWQE